MASQGLFVRVRCVAVGRRVVRRRPRNRFPLTPTTGRVVAAGAAAARRAPPAPRRPNPRTAAHAYTAAPCLPARATVRGAYRLRAGRGGVRATHFGLWAPPDLPRPPARRAVPPAARPPRAMRLVGCVRISGYTCRNGSQVAGVRLRRTRACWKARKKHCVHKKVCFFKFELSPTYPAKRPPPPHAHRHSLPYTVPRTRGGLGCGGEAPAGTPAKFGVICPSRFGDIRRGFPAPPPPTATHSAPPTAGLPASVCDACVRVGKPAPNCRATRCKSFIQFNPPPLIRRNVPHPPHAHRHSLPYTVPRTRGGWGRAGGAEGGAPAKFGAICPSRSGDIRPGVPGEGWGGGVRRILCLFPADGALPVRRIGR